MESPKTWKFQPSAQHVNSGSIRSPGRSWAARGASGQGYGYGPELLDELTATKVVHLEPAPEPGTR